MSTTGIQPVSSVAAAPRIGRPVAAGLRTGRTDRLKTGPTRNVAAAPRGGRIQQRPTSNVTTAVRPNYQALRVQQALGRPLDPHDPATIRYAAGQLASELFFKPLLAEMRSFSFGAEFAHGGHTESVFSAQLDECIADAVATADRGGLVKQIARHLGSPVAAAPRGGRPAEQNRQGDGGHESS